MPASSAFADRTTSSIAWSPDEQLVPRRSPAAAAECGTTEDRPPVAEVRHLDTEQEAHRVEKATRRGGGAWFDVHPRRLTVIDEQQRMLDVPVRRRDQRLGRYAGRKRREVLCRQRVQPGQPVRPTDTDDRAMRQVDSGTATGEARCSCIGSP